MREQAEVDQHSSGLKTLMTHWHGNAWGMWSGKARDDDDITCDLERTLMEDMGEEAVVDQHSSGLETLTHWHGNSWDRVSSKDQKSGWVAAMKAAFCKRLATRWQWPGTLEYWNGEWQETHPQTLHYGMLEWVGNSWVVSIRIIHYQHSLSVCLICPSTYLPVCLSIGRSVNPSLSFSLKCPKKKRPIHPFI